MIIIKEKRDWNKYLHDQLEQECQLVSILNIYYYLTGKIIKQKSVRYKELMNLSGAIAGACIHVYEIFDLLGIKILKRLIITITHILNFL